MTTFNFNAPINRDGTDSVKFDLRQAIFGRGDVIPMWVADMDFAVPPFVLDAVKKRAEHPVYGYSIIPDSYHEAIIEWQQKRHQWAISKDWMLFSPGIVTGLNMIVRALTAPGDRIIVQPPVYFPFFSSVQKNGRELLHNRLVESNGRYSIDFEDLEAKMKEGARMLILCNPHNPVSRCWTREELEWLGAKSIEYGVMVVSDEIHCDLVFTPHRHIPLATLSEELAQQTVTCIAPSKTFNLAGLFTSTIIIPNADLRKKFKEEEERLHVSANIFGITAAEAAYKGGEEWLEELMAYLRQNAKITEDFLACNMPEVTASPLEATYLMWLDFRKWNLSTDKLKKLLIENAGLGLVEGPVFGPGGEGFQRINIACPKAVLVTALEKLFMLRKSLITL